MEQNAMSREERITHYVAVVASHPGSVLKGATIPNTTHNGHMYSYLAKDGTVALRLPTAEREKFLSQYQSKLVEQYGIIQKEYVVVPIVLLQNTLELKPWFEASFNYVNSLKPKPSAKDKKTK